MVHLLTVTTPSSHLAEAKQKRAVVVTSRVHPGETNSSYMMRGFINFITGPSPDAKVGVGHLLNCYKVVDAHCSRY